MTLNDDRQLTNWTLLHARLHRTLKEQNLLPQGRSLLIAVSGGQDSLCLLRLLLELQTKWQWRLAIAHCDHGWREDSTANADYVEQLAQNWGLECHRAVAEAPCQSEAEARQWRYQAFTDMALTQGYSHVVTGHTASDRAETLLYNLMRGSGSDGLQALTWQRNLAIGVSLVRPLLELTRMETAEFCQSANLRVWEDATNQDWRYARNRIRQELFPYLQTHFNPQVELALAQTAELLRAEVECLEDRAELYWQQAVSAEEPIARTINRTVLRSAPLALQRRILRRFLQQSLAIAPNFDQVEKLVALIAAPNQTQTDPFPGGAIARVEGDWIRLT